MMGNLYAILRHDAFHNEGTAVQGRVTVKGIVSDLEFAKREVDRLNHLNEEKGCYYWWTPARWWPPPWKKGEADGSQG
jgi:hypothetical protein